ncbi:MAG: hypothetical protein ACLFTK_12290 [Anaerolineales bacterium]
MPNERHFGLVSQLEVAFHHETHIAEFTGFQDAAEERTFYMLLDRRATHLLWYRLTSALFPEEAPTLTAVAGTAPLQAVDGHPVITSIRLRHENNLFFITGETFNGTWHLHLGGADAERVWASLDVLLHPLGWQGRESSAND